MARPRKNNAEYFSHDASLRNNLKIRALRSKFEKNIGYSTYNMLLEILTEAENFRIPNTDLQRTLIAGDIGIDEQLYQDILDFMVSVQLMSRNDEWIWNEHLIERMEPLIRKRNSMRESYESRTPEEQKDPPPGPPSEPPKPPKAPKKKNEYLLEEHWEAFRERYPKKEHMHKAKEKFMKLERSLWSDILKGLDKWEKSDKWVRGFKHNATTWINGRLWADEPTIYSPDQPKSPKQSNNGKAAIKTGYSDSKV